MDTFQPRPRLMPMIAGSLLATLLFALCGASSAGAVGLAPVVDRQCVIAAVDAVNAESASGDAALRSGMRISPLPR